MRVLDVGCGAGQTTVLLVQMGGEQGKVVGIDNAAALLADAIHGQGGEPSTSSCGSAIWPEAC